ncbi:MAG: extracellular solute-binding protein, partial [Pseudomonadota bacterium]|nr:extracellular solute-binding protein [Pseudomonadota bacterium]
MHGQPKYGVDFDHLDYANPDAPKGGTLKQAALGTFDSLNPYAIKGKAAEGMSYFYDTLMQRVWDEPFTMYPLIAETVEIPEDRSSIAVHVNPNAKFHDGTSVTAEDVLFSFETLRENGRPNMRSIYKLVDEAKIIDDRTVYFHFGEGYDRETVMILTLMPVLSKAWWEGREFDASLLEIPNSSGPYKIAEVEPGRRIVYERDPNYWGKDLPVNRGHYNFDKVIYDYYRDDTVALEAFKSGDLDFRREGNAGKWATAYNFPAIAAGDITKAEIKHGRPEKVRALIFNTRRAPFDDPKVREA